MISAFGRGGIGCNWIRFLAPHQSEISDWKLIGSINSIDVKTKLIEICELISVYRDLQVMIVVST